MIGVCNLDFDIMSELSKNIEIKDMSGSSDFPKIDGLVIDWVHKSNSNFITQAAMIEHYARESIPVVIYDRYMCVTPKEHGWLKKFNVMFLEPALNNREDFEYLPQWGIFKIKESDPIAFELGYIGDLNRKVKLFEKYFKGVAILWPDTSISFYSQEFKEMSKIDEWKKDGIFESNQELYEFDFTILIDSQQNFDIGYLPDNLFELMNYGVVPLCPIEQKYFQGMFHDLIVKNPADVKYFIKSFKNLKNVIITDIYENIKSNYPEFTIEYACDKIMRKLII